MGKQSALYYQRRNPQSCFTNSTSVLFYWSARWLNCEKMAGRTTFQKSFTSQRPAILGASEWRSRSIRGQRQAYHASSTGLSPRVSDQRFSEDGNMSTKHYCDYFLAMPRSYQTLWGCTKLGYALPDFFITAGGCLERSSGADRVRQSPW
jgi:hypothetical protein